MAVRIENVEGAFSVDYTNTSQSGVSPWTEKFGYIKVNVLDSAATDTAAVSSDLWSFAQASTALMDAQVQKVNVSYTAELWGDD